MIHPVPLDSLPPKIKAVCSPKQKVLIRQNAAKGIIPGFIHWEILTTLYILSFDNEPNIATTAKETIKKIPRDILISAISAQEILPEVIDWVTELFLEDEEILEKIITAQKSSDETIAKLAATVNEKLTEIIATNQQRLLRYPEIIEKLYMNKNTPQSIADRVIEFAIREGIELKGIPAFKELKAAILGEGSQKENNELFKETLLVGEELERKGKELEVEEEGKEVEEDEDLKLQRQKLTFNIYKLTVSQKIRLALLGNASHRALLIRDPNKTVSMAAIKSPGITDQEVLKYAQNRALPEDIIRYIAERRDWTKNYQVKLALVNNPKCPISQALNFLSHLRPFDLKAIARSKNVPQAIAQAAANMLKRRE